MRLTHLLRQASLACALLGAASPAAAWDDKMCLNKDFRDLRDFRDELASIVTGNEATSSGGWSALIPKERRQKTYDTITSCAATLRSAERATFDHCMARVRDYAEIVSRSQSKAERQGTSPSLGLDIDNDTYFRMNRKILDVPECLEGSELFGALQATNLSNDVSVKATVALIEKKCTKEPGPKPIILPYVSATVDGLDGPWSDNLGDVFDNRGRIVLRIGDKDVVHYVQFSVNASEHTGDDVQRVQASVVKIKLSDKPPGTKGTYIFDWWRDPRTSKFKRTDNKEILFGNDTHCYACHWSGVLAIHPFRPPTTDDDDVGGAADKLGPDYKGWLSALNETYSVAAGELKEQIKTDTNSPELRKVVGSPRPDRLEGFPDLLSDPSNFCPESDPTGKSAIAKWLETNKNGCTNCHRNRGASIYDYTLYPGIMNKYVAGGLMPPGNSWTSKDRTAVLQCFTSAAAEKVRAWLKGTDCP
jgi:hypothetical protein